MLMRLKPYAYKHTIANTRAHAHFILSSSYNLLSATIFRQGNASVMLRNTDCICINMIRIHIGFGAYSQKGVHMGKSNTSIAQTWYHIKSIAKTLKPLISSVSNNLIATWYFCLWMHLTPQNKLIVLDILNNLIPCSVAEQKLFHLNNVLDYNRKWSLPFSTSGLSSLPCRI